MEQACFQQIKLAELHGMNQWGKPHRSGKVCWHNCTWFGKLNRLYMRNREALKSRVCGDGMIRARRWSNNYSLNSTSKAKHRLGPSALHANSKVTIRRNLSACSVSPAPPLGQGSSCSPWSLPCGWSAPGWWCSTRLFGSVPCSWIANTHVSHIQGSMD